MANEKHLKSRLIVGTEIDNLQSRCYNCGKMEENYSEFQVGFKRTYRFCGECTEKIEKILKEGF